MTKFLSGVAAFATALSLLVIPVTPALAADTTIVVSGNTAAGYNEPGWLFALDPDNATPYEFNGDAASIGVGSLYVEPIGATAAKKFIADNFLNTPIADVNSISYDFQIGSGGTVADANEFYMNVYANFEASDDLKYYDCRFDYVPTTGSTASFTTFTVTPDTVPTSVGGTSCPATLAGMGAGANIRAFSLNVGDTSANDVDLDGYLDNVVVDLTDGVTTFDFEPTPPAVCPVGTTQSASPVDTVTVDSSSSAPTSSTASLLDGVTYLLVSSGTWQNSLNVADTEYASVDNWSTHMDGYDISPWFLGEGEFDLQLNGDFIDWGAYSTEHEYSYLYEGNDSPISFLVFDGDSNTEVANAGWYGDNSGSLSVDIYSCTPDAPADPTEKNQCKKGGWEEFGFKNQGQCIRFVNTGQDSR